MKRKSDFNDFSTAPIVLDLSEDEDLEDERFREDPWHKGDAPVMFARRLKISKRIFNQVKEV